MASMRALAAPARPGTRLQPLINEALDGAMTFLTADFGNIQLVDQQHNLCGSPPTTASRLPRPCLRTRS
jgi:hypothetical protein